jgi:cell division protease FtsH
MKNSGKNFLTWAIIFAVVLVISSLINDPNGAAGNKLVFSEFMKKVDAGEVVSVDIKGSDLNGKMKDGSQFYTYLPEYPDLVSTLQEKGVEINAVPLVSKSDKIVAGIIGWLPLLVRVGLWIYFSRSAGGGGRGGAFGFGKSRAQLLQHQRRGDPR